MIDSFPTNSDSNTGHSVLNMMTRLDPKAAIVIGGLFCITAIVCVGCVVLSGCELELSKNGLSIKQP